MEPNQYCVILVAVPADMEVEHIILPLLENSLVACVQVFDIKSYYTWQGKMTQGNEKMLQIKAKAANYDRIQETVIAHHPYEVPEIIQIPIIKGLDSYLEWVEAVSV